MTKTLYLKASQTGDLELAAKMLREQKLVAFPTETVYGLGGLALDDTCVARIFAAKNRPSNNPLIIHVGDVDAARALFDFKGSAYREHFEKRFEFLSRQYWPGPLTLVGKRAHFVSPQVTAGSSKVAVRIPSHPVALRLLQLVGKPIAAPSANLFTRPSPTVCGHVFASLDGRIDAVVDGGFTEFGIESTVIDIDNEMPRILRPGAVSYTDLSSHLSGLVTCASLNSGDASPGQHIKHYAPKLGQVQLADSATMAKAWFSSSGIILRASTESGLSAQLGKRPAAAGALTILPDDPKGFARELFRAFYEMENAAPKRLLIEDLLTLSNSSDWAAICDRLMRASWPSS